MIAGIHRMLSAACLAPVLLAAEPAFHFKPDDHALGDVHPYIHEGECFLYYLKPGKFDSMLVRSHDWLRWTPQAITHAPVKAEDWMSPYFVLGVFRDAKAGVYRSFYGHAKGRMASSESADLLSWSCASPEFHIPSGDYYERRRDPFVFWIPELNQYGCVMTAWMKGKSKEQGGAISLATSTDLKQWQDHGAIIHPGTIGEPECPQMFALGGRWCLLASIYDRAVGRPVYWSSSSALGPWQSEPAGELDGKDLCAAQVAFDGTVPVLFGWIPLHPARPGKQAWGGHLALPREVVMMSDGKLGTRLASRPAKSFAGLPWTNPAEVRVADERTSLAGTWQHLAAELKFGWPTTGSGELRVRCEPLGEVVLSSSSLRLLDSKGESWSERSLRIESGAQVLVQMFVDDDIVEVFVNGHDSLAARLPKAEGEITMSMQATGSPKLVRVRTAEGASWR